MLYTQSMAEMPPNPQFAPHNFGAHHSPLKTIPKNILIMLAKSVYSPGFKIFRPELCICIQTSQVKECYSCRHQVEVGL
jgi:hypothetical protein